MKRRMWLFVVFLVALLLGTLGNANAQFDPGLKIFLYQQDKVVGEVYVEQHGLNTEGQVTYVEHWVLSPMYKYLGPRYLKALTVKAEPTLLPYRSATDFFNRVSFRPGSKYIKITATESLVE